MTVLVWFIFPVLLLLRPASASDDPSLPIDRFDSGNPQAYEELITDLDTLRSSALSLLNLRLRWSYTTPSSSHTTGILRPSHLLQRIIFDVGRLNGRLLVEKDPGEIRITDFLTGYIEVKHLVGFDRVVVGDFRPGFAQGLIFSRWSRVVFSPDFFKRHDATTIGYHSTSENGTLRGIVLMKTAGPLTLCGFISRNRFDASTGRNGVVFSRRESGLHVTPGERAGEDIQQEHLVGWRWRIAHHRLTFGSTGLIASFTPPFAIRDPQKDPHDFQGNHLRLTGLDWDMAIIPRINLFGEVTITTHQHAAHLIGLRISLPHADFRLLSRYYAPDFYTPYGASISASGETRNESGILGFIRWRPVRSTTIIAWVDQFRRPGGVFSPSSTASGTRFGLSGHRRLAPHWTTDLGIRIKIDTHGTAPADHVLKRTIHGEIVWEPDDWIRVMGSTEATYIHQQTGDPSRGSSSSLDLKFGPIKDCTVEWRTTTFAIGSYNARIIEIEYDAPNTPVPVILTQLGIKHHITASYRRKNRQCSVSYRIKRDRKVTSSRFFLQTDIGL